jgi:hypothetical protein
MFRIRSSRAAALPPPLRLLAATIVVGAVAASSVAHATDEVVITDESRRHFQAGVLLLEDPQTPRYEEAYREFKQAYAGSPSYKILGNLGLSAMKLERDDEAIAAFEKYLKDGVDLEPSERAQVEKDLVTLRAGVVHLEVTSDPPGAMLVDVRVPVRGEPITNTYGPITTSPGTRLGVRQGHHRMTARLPGRPEVIWDFDATGDTVIGHAFTIDLPPPPPPTAAAPVIVPTRLTRPIPTLVYVGAGVTAAFGIATTLAGVQALRRHDEFARVNNGTDRASAESARDTGQTINAVTDVLLGATVVAAGATALFFFTRPTVEVPAGSSGASVRVAPITGGGRAGAALIGSF